MKANPYRILEVTKGEEKYFLAQRRKVLHLGIFKMNLWSNLHIFVGVYDSFHRQYNHPTRHDAEKACVQDKARRDQRAAKKVVRVISCNPSDTL